MEEEVCHVLEVNDSELISHLSLCNLHHHLQSFILDDHTTHMYIYVIQHKVLHTAMRSIVNLIAHRQYR